MKRNTLLVFAFAVLIFSMTAISDENRILQNHRDVEPYYGVSFKYMNCEDTYISPAAPDANSGYAREIVLEAGKTKALIKFTQLNRALGVNRKITKARLVLVPVSGSALSSLSTLRVSGMLVNWGEGSGEGKPSYWGASWNERYSSVKEKGRAWSAPGIKPGVDSGNPVAEIVPLNSIKMLGDVIKDKISNLDDIQKAQPALIIESEQLKNAVQAFYDRHYTNFGWVIELNASEGSAEVLRLHSSQSKELAFRPMLIIESRTTTPPVNSMDLNVTYIERLPEYLRYSPNDSETGNELYEYKSYHGKDDMAGILKKPLYMDEKKWPDEGEEVTFIAHVKNSGMDKETGAFNYTWYINDEKMGSGAFEGREKKGLAPGEETTFELKWKWHADHADHRDQTVTFDVEPVEPWVQETSKNNNQLTDYIEALNLGYYFDDKSYAAFSRNQNGLGSFSPENWVQWQWNMWNETVLAMSRYPGLSPDGCVERVRIQRITVVKNGGLSPYGNHVPDGKSNFYYDGEWGTDNASEAYASPCSKILEGGLLHECTHQISAIDNYWSNMDGSNEKGEGGKVHFKLPNGLYLTRMYWDWDGGLMGGGHTRYADDEPPYGYPFLSAITCAGLNSTVGYRRGFFGDYTYDLPEKLTIVVQDRAGNPIPNAEVTVFQSAAGKLTEEYPVVSGKTNEKGEIVVPPQPIMEDAPVKLATGHVLRPNPWGRVNVVGGNMVFLIRAKLGDQTEYRFLKSLEANVAYWRGAKENWICPMRFAINRAGLKSENIAKGKSIFTKDIQRTNSFYANDGDVKTEWSAGSGAGGYFEVDLGEIKNVGKILWIGKASAKFDIYISENGNFTGEMKNFFAEQDFNAYVAGHSDACVEQPTLREVGFTSIPTRGRYVRFVFPDGGGFTLNELRIFESEK